MTPNQRKIIKICFVILAVSMAVMAVSTVINIVNNGWEVFSIINVVPFIGVFVAMIAIFIGNKDKSDK